VVSPTHRPPLPPGNIPGTHFCFRLSQPQGHSAAGKMSNKNSSDTIGNRSRDLPICGAVPQPLRHTCVIRTNKEPTICTLTCFHYCFNLITSRVSSTCFEHPSVHPQEDSTCSFMVFLSCIHINILPLMRLLIWTHERNIIKLHVQVVLRMNTWMFETCRRHYN
jgi:hypothetical protein